MIAMADDDEEEEEEEEEEEDGNIDEEVVISILLDSESFKLSDGGDIRPFFLDANS